MSNFKAARRYTTALFEIAESQKQVDIVKKDCEDIKKTVDGSRGLKLFIESPIIKPDKKLSVIRDMFSGKVSELTLSFLLLLCEKGRINILYDIMGNMLKLINDRRGIVEAVIITAVEITDIEKKSISEKLQKYSGKEISPHYKIDRSIKGGFIAQIDDKIIDASILRQLELLRKKFVMGNFNN
jgi:F-type H+-transporting ATPase subunit delta